MGDIVIQSDNNVVIQGNSNSECIINGKKYVNGIEVPYSRKQQIQDLFVL